MSEPTLSGAASLVTRLRAQRELWSDVPALPGRRIRLRRPLEIEFSRLARPSLEVLLDYVVGWEGLTEADVFPPGIGSDAALAFSHEVAGDVLGDHAEWLLQVSKDLAGAMKAFNAAREAASGN